MKPILAAAINACLHRAEFSASVQNSTRTYLNLGLVAAAALALACSAANATEKNAASGAPARGKARYCVTIDQVPETTTCAARCAAESWVCSDAGDLPSVVPDRAARCDQPNHPGNGSHVCLCCPPSGNG